MVYKSADAINVKAVVYNCLVRSVLCASHLHLYVAVLARIYITHTVQHILTKKLYILQLRYRAKKLYNYPKSTERRTALEDN